MVHLQLLIVMEYADKVTIAMGQIRMAECGLILVRTVGMIILQILMVQIVPVQIVMVVG
nr:MAG TPA: hypothetical protein [Caudoviricetes sp.]